MLHIRQGVIQRGGGVSPLAQFPPPYHLRENECTCMNILCMDKNSTVTNIYFFT